jgi:hypothetical protein
MSDRIIDLNKARFMRQGGRDLKLYETLAGTDLDNLLRRVGGVKGLFIIGKATSPVEVRVEVYRALIASGITQEELLGALIDSLARNKSGTPQEAALYLRTSSAIYTNDELRNQLTKWGVPT